MATTDAHKVPVTIVSRAQVYTFKLASSDVISRHLSQICEKEKIAIEPDAIQTITKRGGGSFRDSLSLLDQISTISSETITREMVEKALGLPEEVLISELIKKYIARDTTGITTLLKDLFDAGVKAEIIAEEIITEVIASPRPEVLPLLSKLPDVRAPFAEARLIYAITADLRDPSMITTTPSAVKPSIPTKPSALVAEPPKPAPVKSSPVNPFKERIMKSIKPQKDDVNSKISAIMGGEVQEYGGGSPF